MYIRDNLGHDKILVPQEWHMHDGETASDSIGAFAFLFFGFMELSKGTIIWCCNRSFDLSMTRVGHNPFFSLLTMDMSIE
jgi:hypothetical protein